MYVHRSIVVSVVFRNDDVRVDKHYRVTESRETQQTCLVAYSMRAHTHAHTYIYHQYFLPHYHACTRNVVVHRLCVVCDPSRSRSQSVGRSVVRRCCTSCKYVSFARSCCRRPLRGFYFFAVVVVRT